MITFANNKNEGLVKKTGEFLFKMFEERKIAANEL
jgi:hypothetical protein